VRAGEDVACRARRAGRIVGKYLVEVDDEDGPFVDALEIDTLLALNL
jgi:hypothetical protein